MTKNTDFDSQTNIKTDPRSERHRQNERLAEFDQKLGQLIIEADAAEVSPQLLVQTASEHIAEYGCWRADGAAPLVAATMLHGMTRHIRKYQNAEPELNDYLAMEIHIHSEWLEDSDGKQETLELLRAMTQHLCSWMGAHLDPESGPTNGTLH